MARLLPELVSAALVCVACVSVGCAGDAAPPPAAAPSSSPPSPSPPPASHRRVSVAELSLLLQSPQRPVLIDVRPRAEYDAFHIPGAMHRAVHELAHSAAVRAGDPIIIAEGHGIGRLAGVLEELRAGGRDPGGQPGSARPSVDVRVLDLGMAAWCAAGEPTTGRCQDADVVGPERLFELAGCAEQAASGRPRLLVDWDGSSIDLMRAAFRGTALEGSVFFVRGGLAAFFAFVARHEAMIRSETFVSQGLGGPRQDRAVVAPKKDCGCL